MNVRGEPLLPPVALSLSLCGDKEAVKFVTCQKSGLCLHGFTDRITRGVPDAVCLGVPGDNCIIIQFTVCALHQIYCPVKMWGGGGSGARDVRS